MMSRLVFIAHNPAARFAKPQEYYTTAPHIIYEIHIIILPGSVQPNATRVKIIRQYQIPVASRLYITLHIVKKGWCSESEGCLCLATGLINVYLFMFVLWLGCSHSIRGKVYLHACIVANTGNYYVSAFVCWDGMLSNAERICTLNIFRG